MKKTTMEKVPRKPREKKEMLPAVIEEKSVQIVDPQSLIKMAIERGTGIDVIEKLLAMRERIQADIASKEFREAMSGFQSECPVIEKKRKVFSKDKTLRYKFASLDDILKAVQPILSRYNLSYDIETAITMEPSMIQVTVKVFHTLGHSKTTSFSVPVDMDAYMSAPQRWAAAQTYAKRYAFCNAFGILTGDEDTDAIENKTDDEEKQKAKKEAIEQIEKLPENIRKGFEILEYTKGTAYIFCQRFGWENVRILAEINKIIDMKAKLEESR